MASRFRIYYGPPAKESSHNPQRRPKLWERPTRRRFPRSASKWGKNGAGAERGRRAAALFPRSSRRRGGRCKCRRGSPRLLTTMRCLQKACAVLSFRCRDSERARGGTGTARTFCQPWAVDPRMPRLRSGVRVGRSRRGGRPLSPSSGVRVAPKPRTPDSCPGLLTRYAARHVSVLASHSTSSPGPWVAPRWLRLYLDESLDVTIDEAAIVATSLAALTR
jgi:hypothetical protein